MNLLSLASKQLWPHIILVAHLRPQRLFLLHTDNTGESKGPAQRLKRFLDGSDLIQRGSVRLESISDSDFQSIENQLDRLQTHHRLLPDECIVNFTGGNKLMATAAFRWAAKRGVRSLYLERRNRLTRFEPRDGDIATRTEQLDGHITDSIDPLAILRCQLDASEVERNGQLLTLNSSARQLSDDDFWKRLPSLSADQVIRWLDILGDGNYGQNQGDALELIVAAALLRHGVRQVRRSLRLKVHSAPGVSARLPHAEIDLLFNYGGKLWLVDCKDRKPVTDLADGLLSISRPREPSQEKEFQDLSRRVREQLSISDTKVIKEDLLSAREMGGLLGETICVRRSAFSDEVREFARRNSVHVVENCRQPNALREKLLAILHPQTPASIASLKELSRHLGR